jgi:hypothetical protein
VDPTLTPNSVVVEDAAAADPTPIPNPIVVEDAAAVVKKKTCVDLTNISGDMDIDRTDQIEIYSIHRSWGCQKWIREKQVFCLEDTVVNDQFCAKHKSNLGKIPYKIAPHEDALVEINPVHFKHHDFTGQIWFPRLLLVAQSSSEGLVVIGRLIGGRWMKTLTDRDVKRCQNSGLLYKIIPQRILHYNYHVKPVDKIEGIGFISYDDMRIQRPSLYIKYWKIWNSYILERKKFITTYDGYKHEEKWMMEHTCPLPNWTEIKTTWKIRGFKNIIVPPPTEEQVRDLSFDVWEYCRNWVHVNEPDKISEPHFPPIYLDYVDPYSMRFRPYNKPSLRSKFVNIKTPRRTKHYKKDAEEWIRTITEGGKEWMHAQD